MPIEIPQNQTDALPIETAAAAADPGDIELVNGRVTRHWTPDRTGINGIHRREFAFPPFGSQMWVAQGFSGDPLSPAILDFAGVGTFTFRLRRELTGPVQPLGPLMAVLATPVTLGQSPLPFDIINWPEAISRLGHQLCQIQFNTAPAVPADQYGFGGCSGKAGTFDVGGAGAMVGGVGWVVFLVGSTAAVAGEFEFWYLDIWGDS